MTVKCKARNRRFSGEAGISDRVFRPPANFWDSESPKHRSFQRLKILQNPRPRLNLHSTKSEQLNSITIKFLQFFYFILSKQNKNTKNICKIKNNCGLNASLVFASCSSTRVSARTLRTSPNVFIFLLHQFHHLIFTINEIFSPLKNTHTHTHILIAIGIGHFTYRLRQSFESTELSQIWNKYHREQSENKNLPTTETQSGQRGIWLSGIRAP